MDILSSVEWSRSVSVVVVVVVVVWVDWRWWVAKFIGGWVCG